MQITLEEYSIGSIIARDRDRIEEFALLKNEIRVFFFNEIWIKCKFMFIGSDGRDYAI